MDGRGGGQYLKMPNTQSLFTIKNKRGVGGGGRVFELDSKENHENPPITWIKSSSLVTVPSAKSS